MTAKALTLALAATTAAATFADVYEVKFTVKTRVGEKVANKVISGLYDSDQDKHVFWTVQKLPNEKGKLVNTNVPYTGTYFGPSNGTEAGKSYGTNAELIWGDNNENVLVAGAWGKTSKLSGQAAGMLDLVPATGTWSAKINTKMSYDQLLAKYGVDQTENKSTGVIDDLKNKAADDLADAKQKAADDLIAAQEKAAKEIEAAQAEGEEAVAAAEAKAAKDLADAEEDYKNKLAAADEDYKNKLADAEEKAAQDLAEKQKDLELANKELETLVGSLKNIDDADVKGQISKYLKETLTEAKGLKHDSETKINEAKDAFVLYTNSLNVAALVTAVDDAKTNVTAKTQAYKAAQAVVDAWTVTNDMVVVIDADVLYDHYYDAVSGVIAQKEGDISPKKVEIDGAVSDLESYTNNLVRNLSTYQKNYNNATNQMAAAETSFDEAEDKLKEAQDNLDNFVAPTPVTDANMQDYDTFCAKHIPPYDTDTLEARTAYGQYTTEYIANAKLVYENAVLSATNDYNIAKNTYDQKVRASVKWHTNVTNTQAKIDAAVKSGEKPDSTKIADLKAELKTLESERDALKADYEFWKTFKYSDDDKLAFAQALIDAKAARDATAEALTAAQEALSDAETALNMTAPSTQAYYLNAIGTAISKNLSGLTGVENVDKVEKAVDDYLNAPLGGEDGKSLLEHLEFAERTIAAIENIKAEMGIE